MTEQLLPAVIAADKVRINATYTPARIGDAVVAGHPESVDIILNDDALPADPAERLAFLASLVDALFRGSDKPAVTEVHINNAGPLSPSARQVGVEYAKGGQVR